MAFNYLICDGCGWVHFGVSLNYATEEVTKFNQYYDTLAAKEQKELYGGKKSCLANYCFCFLCGSLYTRMRELTPEDNFPAGSTVQPILDSRKANYEPVIKNESSSKRSSSSSDIRRRSLLSPNSPKRKNRRKD